MEGLIDRGGPLCGHPWKGKGLGALVEVVHAEGAACGKARVREKAHL